MRRWGFVTGLTIMLLLLLVLSGYCVWVTRGLTSDLDRLIALNYDKIRAVRDLRSAMTRINARYLGASSAGQVPSALGMFENESAVIRQQMKLVQADDSDPRETERYARLQVLVRDYFENYRRYFTLDVAADKAQRDRLWDDLARGTADISEQGERIVQHNERMLFERRDAAVARGRMFGWFTLGIAGISVGIYVYTSVRLTQGVFRPLRRLRDAIQQVGMRKFDAVEPLEGGEELNQIAITFNQMARELRAYIAETDQRSVEASRISRAILEALPYPIYIVDEAYHVRLKNPRAQALSAALNISGRLPAVVRKCVDDAAAIGSELVGDDLRRAVEIPLADTTGPVPTFLPQVFRMADVPGSTAGWAVLLVDVTRLRQFDQAKTKAIATLGHEVKTPVTSIRMALHLLLEERIGPLTGDQRELVTAGRDDCERLLTILQALLELARFEGGRVEMKLQPASPAELLSQAEAMHGSFLRSREAALTIEPVPESMPWVQADSIHVGRLLGNLLSNAAKYRTPGTPVSMRAEARADGFVRLSVRNHTTTPLSESDQARIFDPFYRRAGTGTEGTGLGLTICREIAALHHGRVGVHAMGHEVEFYLDLRVASSDSLAVIKSATIVELPTR